MTSIILWGGTGHARVLNDILIRAGETVVAVFDRKDVPSPIPGVPLFVGRDGFEEWRRRWSGPLPEFAIAIGGKYGRDRLELADWLTCEGLRPTNVIHAAAIVEPSAQCELGSQVLAGAVVGAAARLGRQSILNTRASLDHDSVAGNGVHIGPGATICGAVTIGDGSFIGAGATVLPFVLIGCDAIIGAGSVVNRNIPDGATVVGVPARVIPTSASTRA